MKSTLLFLTLAMAGCSAQTDEPTPSAPGAAEPSSRTAAPTPHEGTAARASGAMATATGIVTAVDVSARRITISHEPVPALNWPAMTMDFSVRDVDLTGIQLGDKVTFEFTTEGMSSTITRITRQ
ncbi:MAG: copper-binding protein [Chiayiivirga sp.]|jgi:Cu(I)/Ag(I) efflux system protein CusF|uniref:copper-binding protein n=1 Tax=Chiayiivirga sp. TaxID=2041042 RepID=UPI0025C32C9D|nr:copper-binding protein [Chiayiivirga sp.]MCI1709703.1 copper-binding protein [Chiayiivirga sp.]MCI1730011.1 copper-binding protein [Chiayiivirga sp.]